MKRRILIPLLIILIALTSGAIYVNPLLPIITGYAAKNIASGIFISGRTQKQMEEEDLNFSAIKFTKNIVNYEKKEVVSKFLWGKSKAIYIDGFGCTLVTESNEHEVKSRNYPKQYSTKKNNTILELDTIHNYEKLKKATDKIFSNNPSFSGTFGLIVLQNNKIIFERYRSDFNKNTRFLSWSMAKSFTNALIGIRVKEGKIDIRKPLELSGNKKNITINNLLQMNSGLEWNENYGNQSDVTIMLHKESNMGLYAWNKPSVAENGQKWYYSSGSTNTACLALRNSFNSDIEYWKFPKQQLFDKLEMHSAIFELDASGTFVGSSYIYATLRDYAKFGLLYLNNGCYNNQQILSENWVEYTKTVATGSGGKYGSAFWLNANGEMEDTPTDALMCRGHDGQFIIIIPSKNIVIVRTGYTPKGNFNLNLMIKEILSAL